MYIRKVPITPGMREAAKLFDIPVSAVRHAIGIMKYRPDLKKEVVDGRMTLFDAYWFAVSGEKEPHIIS